MVSRPSRLIRWCGKILKATKRNSGFRNPLRRFRLNQIPSIAIIEILEPRLVLDGTAPLLTAPPVTPVVARPAPLTPQQLASPDNPTWAWWGGFFSGAGTGLYNMGAGVVVMGQNVVTIPIDLVGTTVSSTYQPISYYGQASQTAIQTGTPWYYITGATAINAGSLGTSGLATSGYQYYLTGDPTAFQQTTGAFAFCAFLAYGIQQYNSPTNAPTYNLGGEGEIPGAINVQPPGAPIPPDPAIIALSDPLPISPSSGNVVATSAPIAPQPGLATLGPPYNPVQIANIASGGFTITITQVAETTPGTLTAGQAAVISAAPVGSTITVAPVPPFMTTVVIVTPAPLANLVVPYTVLVIQSPDGNLVQYVFTPEQPTPPTPDPLLLNPQPAGP